ncbi:MAG: Fic family protein [Candidatus Micrarchaeota archaeon]|nr:Fic family protein [Candidatus Micrarchaeota archaeon]
MGKVKKAKAFLGSDLKKGDLRARIKEVEAVLETKVTGLKAIGDPYKTALSEQDINELRTLWGGGRIELQHLSESDWERFVEVFTYDTNAIEGSTVTKGEVKNILENNKWPDKSKDEIAETTGVAEAVAYIRKTRDHLSTDLIKKLHWIIFKNSKQFAGKIRARGVEVAVVSTSGDIIHRGTKSTLVASHLSELIRWDKKSSKKYPPLVLAAVVHNQFEVIHPFQDGNGRVGRLILNNILLKYGLPPVNIELKNRKAYYDALRIYGANGNLRPILELILKEYKSLKKLLK